MRPETPAARSMDEEDFSAPSCRNCGAPLETPFCGRCGQKRVNRLGFGEIRSEVWEKMRYFEGDLVKSAFAVIRAPGLVARDYVLGARKKHVHPLKLLLSAIVVLLLILARTRYLDSSNAVVSRAMEIIRSYSQWSFSLGIVALLIASNLVFWRRLNYRVIEHGVLAVYTHFVILVASIANQLVLMAFYSPAFAKLHRFYSSYYMDAIEATIVFLAFGQFFRIDWRRQFWWPALAALVFVLAKKGLIYLYALLLVKLIIAKII
ncbi:MAG: DUF3667 domain-containing protein [Proteobacteria bacterium]|nr:DUF3667 domain-containing protein [Pseudomonadota bacterium]